MIDKLSKTLLIFPTSRAIRGFIEQQQYSNTFLPKIITIGDLFSKVVLNENKTLISKDLRILYLKQAISNIDMKKLGLASNFSKFYNQSEYIFKFFNELNNEYKAISDLNDSDTYAFYLEHLEVLNKIYTQYMKILDKNNKIDSSTISTDYSINRDYISDFDEIVIYYEGYFSSFEFEVIKSVAKQTQVIIHTTINQFNNKNIDMFGKIDIDLQPDYIYKLDITNKIILEEKSYINKLENHKIYPVQQRITQIAFIKYALTNMVKGGIEPQNIAVVLPDEKFASYLQLFDDEKYFNFAMGNDIKLSNTYINANAIANYLNSDEPKDKYRIEFLSLNIEFIEQTIKINWDKKLEKNIFFEIVDFIYQEETNEDIIEQILQIKLSMDILLFSNDILFDDNNYIKLKDAYKILLQKINKITIDDKRSGKITVLGILETRNIKYDGIIVIDFNDSIVPKRSIKDKFISTKVKENTNLPTLKHREDLQKYYYKRLFDNAKQIYISYVNDDANTISRFSSQLFLKQNIINGDFSKILNMQNDIKLYDEDIYMDINLSLNEWSATSLKEYLQCKRKYYFNYILGIKEHNISLKPPSYEIGNILHKVLEKIYKNNALSYSNIQKELSSYQNKNPYLTLELEVWKRKIELFVQKELKRFENEQIQIYALEIPFKIQYKNITIKGVIDRIDKLKDNSYAILDYKTSKNLQIDKEKDLEQTNDFQLEFYALARRDLNITEVGYYDLNDGSIKPEIFLDEKIKILDNVFKSLETKRVNFTKCEDTKLCTFCIYKTICARN
jgi:CRISPR/Cas system-associated exonuclease Cas4 (RecB family)